MDARYQKERDGQGNGRQIIAIFAAFLSRTIFGRCHSGRFRAVHFMFLRPPLLP